MLCDGRPLDIALLVDKLVVNFCLCNVVLELRHEIVVESPRHERATITPHWHSLKAWRRAMCHGSGQHDVAELLSGFFDLSIYPVGDGLDIGRSST